MIEDLPIHVPIEGICSAISTGFIQRGDCVLVRSGERGPLNWIINRAQRRALRDAREWLPLSDSQIAQAAGYTHTATVMDEVSIGEMYHPRARLRYWHALTGCEVLIRRPRTGQLTEEESRKRRELIAVACMNDIRNRVSYPDMELLSYWWKWTVKTATGRKFADVFRSDKSNVCSGQYVSWCARAGLPEFVNENPEAHYPAMQALTPLMDDVQLFVIDM